MIGLRPYKEISGSFSDYFSLILGKPHIRLNNLKTNQRFPCLCLNPIILSFNYNIVCHHLLVSLCPLWTFSQQIAVHIIVYTSTYVFPFLNLMLFTFCALLHFVTVPDFCDFRMSVSVFRTPIQHLKCQK